VSALLRRAAGYQGDALNLPVAFRAFFVVAPDGLCYMIGEPVP